MSSHNQESNENNSIGQKIEEESPSSLTNSPVSSDAPTKIPSNEYGADNIVVLEGLEGVRKRPAMYIGSTGIKGFHHLAFEIIDNSIDEALAGHCSKITLTLEKDNSCTIRDNGRGIPVSKHPTKGISTLEVIFSSLHSGGKFDKKSYKVSGGLHGVGLAVVNACSEWAIARVCRKGKIYTVKMGKGHITEQLTMVEGKCDKNKSWTEVSFYPDKEIFTSILPEDFRFDIEYLSSRLRDLSFLNPIEIEIIDTRGDEDTHEMFKHDNGTSDFVSYLNQAKKLVHPNPIRFIKERDGIMVDLSFQYNETYNELIQCFVNNINTVEGGTHLVGFKSALTRVFNNYIKAHGKEFKNEKSLKGSDIREGLVAVLSVSVPEPQFEGQTKTKLGNPEVKAIVSEIVYDEVMHHFDSNPNLIKPIIMKSLLAQKARVASQKARELTRRKSALDGLRLPGKLADCSSKDPKECEIFIVEGDSAGGSAKQGRDRGTQAILPLRGKILNVEKSRLTKILANKEIASMIKAIGVGISEEDDDNDDDDDDGGIKFDISSLRYDKIIIMCDADVDGHHIETLLLTFFFRFMRPLVDAGHIYLAVPPIYKLVYNKKFKYLYIEDDQKLLQRELSLFQKENTISDISKIKSQRFKGLGEMNPQELWETTMEPSSRTLHRVKYADFASTDNMFSVLMGSEVEPRRKYIMDNYNKVQNLDI